MPWPAFRPNRATRQISEMSWSLPPERSASRRSVSSRENRQVRTRPSAVRRVRRQSAQKGRVTEAITPTRPRRSEERRVGKEGGARRGQGGREMQRKRGGDKEWVGEDR